MFPPPQAPPTRGDVSGGDFLRDGGHPVAVHGSWHLYLGRALRSRVLLHLDRRIGGGSYSWIPATKVGCVTWRSAL